MYEGSPVELQMNKVVSVEGIYDDATHQCQVYKYDAEEDYIYLLLKENDLTAISLDAKYQCYISTKKEVLSCSGFIKERYQCQYGNMMIFKISDGFSKAPGMLSTLKKRIV